METRKKNELSDLMGDASAPKLWDIIQLSTLTEKEPLT